ncbi:hypothetical protein F5146DRAFT_938253 [Armillaria mellea]|nr:hypothetical protein F5146DRAFT_938253 [Armillaria mellea]
MNSVEISPTLITAPYYLPPPDGARAYKNINDRTDHNYIRHNVTVPIENIRGKEHQYLLDKAGFQYFQHASKHTAFNSDDDVIREYYPETEELYKKLTGATKVFIFDHTIRRHCPGDMEESPMKRQPVFNVHVDQTPAAARARVFRHLPESEARELVKHRFQVLNLWRPIENPALDTPLGFIDSSTVDEKIDLFPMTLKFPGGPGETYAVKWNARHKWVYLRGMTPGEIVIFKCFDSTKDEAKVTFNAHSSFVDPNTPEGSPLRQSIELRALVFYEEE